MNSGFFRKRFSDPLFYVGLVTLGFWLADSYLKISILEAPSRMLWYSAAGLLVTAVGLFLRSSLLLTAMFCALVINESVWTISFFSNLIFHKDFTHVAEYAFRPNYPWYKFAITIYHLTLVPAIVIGLATVKRVHKFGFLAAYVFALILGLLSYLFPDAKENVNCIQRETIGSCRLYFANFYQFGNFGGAVLAISSLAVFVYLPINLLLLFVAKKLGWRYD